MTTTENRAAVAGQMLAKALLDARTIDPLPADLFPADLAEAAAIQDEMARQVGHEVAGWKVGGEAGPMVGRIFTPSLFASPATLPLNQFFAPKIESELGFRLLSDLPPREEKYDSDEVEAACALALTFELTGSRITDGKHSPENEEDMRMIVADNAAHAALVVGSEIRNWQHLSLLDIVVDLRIDGGPVLPMQPRDIRNDPRDILVWLTNELSNRGIGLQAGQLISTGSATVPQPFSEGRHAHAIYADFGEVELTKVVR
jgi:2-keto-4-pentenoate hydratase